MCRHRLHWPRCDGCGYICPPPDLLRLRHFIKFTSRILTSVGRDFSRALGLVCYLLASGITSVQPSMTYFSAQPGVTLWQLHCLRTCRRWTVEVTMPHVIRAWRLNDRISYAGRSCITIHSEQMCFTFHSEKILFLV